MQIRNQVWQSTCFRALQGTPLSEEVRLEQSPDLIPQNMAERRTMFECHECKRCFLKVFVPYWCVLQAGNLHGIYWNDSLQLLNMILERPEAFFYFVSCNNNIAIIVSHLYFLPSHLIVLGFNDTSTLMGHSVLSPREREKRDRRDSRGDEREGQGRKRNRNESEETEEIKTFYLYHYLLQG